MSSTTADLVTTLNTATFWINRIILPLQIVFGTFGNLFSIIIFIRRSFRKHPCSMYFLAGSINNCFVIYIILLTRYLAINWNIDPSATNTVLCKLRTFFLVFNLDLILWFIVLASIDRFLSSSHNARVRQLSSLPRARKIIVFTIISIFLLHAHILFFFSSGVSNGIVVCTYFSNEYAIFLNFYVPVLYYILPIILMSVFGILMILNVRHIHNRAAPQGNDARNNRFRANDRQLIIMLLIQLLVSILISIPYSAFSMYNIVGLTVLKYRFSTTGQAIYNFAYNLSRLLFYNNPVVGFYIYSLFGSKFRAEMKCCIQYALKSALTAIGIVRCLPERAQRALLGESQAINNSQSLAQGRRGNAVHPIQHQKSIIMTSRV